MTGAAVDRDRDPDQASDRDLEAMIAVVLKAGTIMASAIVAFGLAVGWLAASADSTLGATIVMTGLAFFLMLPCLRVLLMLIAFVRRRDYAFGAVAALVLSVIGLALVIGDLAPAHPASGRARDHAGTALTYAFSAVILCTDRYKNVDHDVQRHRAAWIAPNTCAHRKIARDPSGFDWRSAPTSIGGGRVRPFFATYVGRSRPAGSGPAFCARDFRAGDLRVRDLCARDRRAGETMT